MAFSKSNLLAERTSIVNQRRRGTRIAAVSGSLALGRFVRNLAQRLSDTGEVTAAQTPIPPAVVAKMRRTRRHPRPTQFDYLHIRRLVDDLAAAVTRVAEGVEDVLDVYCGARPYDDLLPPGARVVGLDVPGNPYGLADVVSDEFLPFPDESFDLVMCIEAFHYVPDPVKGVTELARVLRPGGHAVIAVPLVWEYNRTILEHRYTGPELALLFEGWEDVSIVENGGRAVAWATLTGSLAGMVQWNLPERPILRRALRPAFVAFYLLVNGTGLLLDYAERRYARNSLTLPMNLLVTARRPLA
jgi:SAM-dependent methyltransferase